MDWTLAMDRNQRMLLRLVRGLFALVGLNEEETIAVLPRPVALRIFRVLRPAEAATRRLIVIAEFVLALSGVASSTVTKRPGLSNKIPKGTGKRIPAFRLLDPRKRFNQKARRRGNGPRIWFFDSRDPAYNDGSPPQQSETLDAGKLCARLYALKNALDDLPKQVKRLRRLRMRRADAKKQARSPMRPGRPPGHRERHTHVIDAVLRDCHQLALMAVAAPNTS